MKKTLITLLILGLVGCNDSSDSSVSQPEQKKPVAETPEQLVEALQENGKMPVLDVSKDILANDTDNDGVRDEIQTYIESKEIPAKQKEKALEFAKVTQSAMSIDLSNDVQVNQFANDMGKAIDCLIESSESDEDALKMLQELEAYTVNTEERAKAYKEFNQSLAGGVFSIPDSVDCGE